MTGISACGVFQESWLLYIITVYVPRCDHVSVFLGSAALVAATLGQSTVRMHKGSSCCEDESNIILLRKVHSQRRVTLLFTRCVGVNLVRSWADQARRCMQNLTQQVCSKLPAISSLQYWTKGMIMHENSSWLETEMFNHIVSTTAMSLKKTQARSMDCLAVCRASCCSAVSYIMTIVMQTSVMHAHTFSLTACHMTMYKY